MYSFSIFLGRTTPCFATLSSTGEAGSSPLDSCGTRGALSMILSTADKDAAITSSSETFLLGTDIESLAPMNSSESLRIPS